MEKIMFSDKDCWYIGLDYLALIAMMLTHLLSPQDGLDALVYDLDFPALRKNKSIDNFLNRCK